MFTVVYFHGKFKLGASASLWQYPLWRMMSLRCPVCWKAPLYEEALGPEISIFGCRMGAATTTRASWRMAVRQKLIVLFCFHTKRASTQKKKTFDACYLRLETAFAPPPISSLLANS